MEISKVFVKCLCITFLLFGCNSKEWQNTQVIKYPSGAVKGIRYWNEEMRDEYSILFSEAGDTLELRRILHPQMAVAYYIGDTTKYSFYIVGEDSIWHIHEWLTCVNNKKLEGLSSYVYLSTNGDDLKFTHIGLQLDQFSLLLYSDSLDMNNFKEIKSDNAKDIITKRSKLKDHIVIGILKIKVRSGDEVYLHEREVYLSDSEKRLFQDLFKLNVCLE